MQNRLCVAISGFMLVEGIFVGLPAATLATMLTEWQACLSAIATAHQSYSLAGRTFTRANLAEVSKMVAEINHAIQRGSNQLIRTTYADMSC